MYCCGWLVDREQCNKNFRRWCLRDWLGIFVFPEFVATTINTFNWCIIRIHIFQNSLFILKLLCKGLSQDSQLSRIFLIMKRHKCWKNFQMLFQQMLKVTRVRFPTWNMLWFLHEQRKTTGLLRGWGRNRKKYIRGVCSIHKQAVKWYGKH